MKIIDNVAPAAAGLRTLERGLDVLDLFSHGATKLTLSEISAKIKLSPSTTSRILHTLMLRGYLSRDEEAKKFSIGSQALRLTASSFRTFDLRPLAAPIMRRLAEQYNESITLYVVLNGFRVCIDRIDTTHALRHVVNIGDRLPLARGAGGKALMAWLPEEELVTVLPAGETFSTAELARIRKQGYALSLGERDQGVGAIAAPVFDAAGRIQCSLSLAAPLVRLNRDRFVKIAPDIVNAANQISAALGNKK
jgi:DNA-binding IclR family transcriptional regulator